jgi:hypothetical protein
MVFARLTSAIIIVSVHASVFEFSAPLSDVLLCCYAVFVYLCQLVLHFNGAKRVLPIKAELLYNFLVGQFSNIIAIAYQLIS